MNHYHSKPDGQGSQNGNVRVASIPFRVCGGEDSVYKNKSANDLSSKSDTG
uniref:Aquaporin Aquaporin PIP2.7 n=1 Tax=Rhizophora mucronata TaxID=61149 RepID=A0A2P2JAF7_RHIMU